MIKRKNNSNYIILTLLLVTFILLTACKKSPDQIKTLADLSTFDDQIIYIKENDNYQPYYALQQKDDAVLLLRKLLLPDTRPFNKNEKMGAYYANSEIDSFLNTNFIKQLSTLTRYNIVTSQIEITSLESLGSTGEQKETIERKVFLLSHHELGLPELSTVVKEGQPIAFFNSKESRIAYLEGENVACGWWTRTPDCWYDSVVLSYSYNGVVGGAGIEHDNGVRPAFYLKADTPLKRRDDIESDKSIFVLE